MKTDLFITFSCNPLLLLLLLLLLHTEIFQPCFIDTVKLPFPLKACAFNNMDMQTHRKYAKEQQQLQKRAESAPSIPFHRLTKLHQTFLPTQNLVDYYVGEPDGMEGEDLSSVLPALGGSQQISEDDSRPDQN